VRDRDVAAFVQRSLDDLKAARESLEDLRERLQSYEVAELLAGSAAILAGAVSARLVTRAFADRTPEEAKRLAQRLTAEGGAIALLGLRAGERAHLIFAQSPGLPFDVGALLKATCARYGGRGGGSRDLAQGGLPDAGRLEEALQEAARQLVQG
jgi:alanyl-tRNA synthetase